MSDSRVVADDEYSSAYSGRGRKHGRSSRGTSDDECHLCEEPFDVKDELKQFKGKRFHRRCMASVRSRRRILSVDMKQLAEADEKMLA